MPVILQGVVVQERGAVFRGTFSVPQVTSPQVLTVRAMRGVAVFLDGFELVNDLAHGDPWRDQRFVTLPTLSPGTHRLILAVQSADSHPAVLAYCKTLKIQTGPDWETTKDGGRTWRPAMLARSPHRPEISFAFPTSIQALQQVAPWLMLVFSVTVGWSLLRLKKNVWMPAASTFRWALLILWVLLAANNIFRIPLGIGMDSAGHLEYIKAVALNGRIPLATEGWQMFQAPLAYILYAAIYNVFHFLGEQTCQHVLRLLPVLCGIAQLECSYCVLKALFPQREDIQVVGTALGGFLPMNIYLCQVIGNEPLAAALSSVAILLVIRRFASRKDLLDAKFGLRLGLVLGLGLLAKTTVLLLIPLLLLFCLWAEGKFDSGRSLFRNSWRFIASGFVSISGVAGWYYIRNWILLGKPWVAGWDPSRGTPYWQDHGYVPVSFLHTFGEALNHPIFAQTAGPWDGLYATLWTDASLSGVIQSEFRPPWNYDFMLSCALLAILPMVLMIIGIVRGRANKEVRLCLIALLVYVAAILHIYISTIPSYATLKATYLLGLTPCLVILMARGLEGLPTSPWIRSIVHGFLATFVAASYVSYFILR
ncbi:hypothetical protein [Geothrix sp. PMB-07]|uniref:hypothetical protein n=1 Tax=Geothrix sp. PMB-07 TaxID=3068640 RepID=UPI002740A3D0|nr:hypothetical protein [Geothrix sp. PMB-07]WLT30602.1 hypothetical protein Q9293_12840 [Geothrix sp. PMB-07]